MKNNIVFKTLYRGRILYLIMVVMAFLGGILAIIYAGYKNNLPGELAASRFSQNASQVSVYFNQSADISEETIDDILYSMRKQLSVDGISGSENGRQIISTFAKEGDIKLFADPRSAEVHAYVVNPDFFYFNNADLLVGSYFIDTNIAKDVCIVTEETAFELFGSTEVEGKIIYCEGDPLLIVGVIKNDYSKLAQNAGYYKKTIYILPEFAEGHINTGNVFYFSYVCENQYDGYAIGLLNDILLPYEGKYIAVENTTRFNANNIFKKLKAFNTISMSSNSIGLPWWENMARGIEVKLMIILFLESVLLGIPAVVFFVSILYMIWNKTYTFKDFMKLVNDCFEQIKKRIIFRRKRNEKNKKNS